MLIVVFGVFRGVWVVDDFGKVEIWNYGESQYLLLTNLIYTKVFRLNGRWQSIDSIGNLFYLGHNDSDGDGREEMYFFYKSSYYPDTFYISGSCAIR